MTKDLYTSAIQKYIVNNNNSNNHAAFSSFMTYHVCNKSNTTGAICGAGTVTHTEHLKIIETNHKLV
jgi:hypothetical protein